LPLSECKFNTNFNFYKFLILFYQKTFHSREINRRNPVKWGLLIGKLRFW
jgi:hypothetical protein